ncbi:hypothetical protein ABZV14_27900 [Streptosporangium canum]|uniref:hypothetical protein n=1 Tax=Streptosporangium canum TaxID=324952 RepID=UPI0033AD5C15
MREIHVHIDEVMFDGAEGSDLDAFRAALERTLRALAEDHDGEYSSGRAIFLDGQPVVAPADGAAVARSVWHSIVPSATRGATP